MFTSYRRRHQICQDQNVMIEMHPETFNTTTLITVSPAVSIWLQISTCFSLHKLYIAQKTKITVAKNNIIKNIIFVKITNIYFLLYYFCYGNFCYGNFCFLVLYFIWKFSFGNSKSCKIIFFNRNLCNCSSTLKCTERLTNANAFSLKTLSSGKFYFKNLSTVLDLFQQTSHRLATSVTDYYELASTGIDSDVTYMSKMLNRFKLKTL